MKFGLFYLPTYLPEIRDVQTHYRGIIEQVEFAERIGIDYVWLVEHHFVRHGGLFTGQLCVPVLPGGTHQAHPARHRRHGAAAQRSGAGGGAGRDPGPVVARPARFWRRLRLHS